MSDFNKPFKADDEITDPEINYRTSLNLAKKPAGSYFFNKENNFEYTKNWFNYNKFNLVDSETIVTELVQYGSPPFKVGELDTSKNFTLPSTTMTPQWIARIETGENFIDDSFQNLNDGWSGVDLGGNTYLVANYTNLNNANVYNQDGSLAFPMGNNGEDSSSVCFAKINTSGNAIWAVRIKTGDPDGRTWATGCVTNNQGTTFIAGFAFSGDTIQFEQAFESSIDFIMPFNGGYIVAYTPSGTVDWVNVTSPVVHQLWVDNLPLENLYAFALAPAQVQSTFNFYDGLPSAPTLVASIPSNARFVVAKWRATSGLFQWATYLEGEQIFNYGERGSNIYILRPNQGITTDPDGNLIVTGSYVEIEKIYNAITPTQPTAVQSELVPPPVANLIVWNPRENNRNWSGVALSSNGQYMVATVENGFIYVSEDYGANWTPRATIQKWSSIWCSTTGQIMVATILDSVIYISSDYGATWSIALGEGSNARAWVSVSGDAFGNYLVACAQNDYLYYSNDQGATWNVASSEVKNWIDIAYNPNDGLSGIYGRFIAIVQNGKAYTSIDGGVNWSLLGASISANWVAICPGTQYVGFYAAVKNGSLYSVSYTGNTWTVIEATPRNWTDISANFSYGLATELNGAIYISQATFENTWSPTTVPRDWNKIAISGGDYALASVEGGQLYVSSNVKIVSHTFILKYNSDGIAQWINYVNSPATDERTNYGVCVATQSNGNIIVSGTIQTQSQLNFFAPSDFETPIKTLTNNFSGGKYLACWSPEGLPLWVNKMNMYSQNNDQANLTAISTDINDNIYFIGYSENDLNPSIRLFQPTEQLVYTSTWPLHPDGRLVLLKYYPDGFAQSVSTIEGNSGIPPITFPIRVIGNGIIYFSGWYGNIMGGSLTAYTSDRNPPSIIESFNMAGVFAVKYNSEIVPSISFTSPGYNLVFQPQFNIGGSTRYLVGEYAGDGAIETWGGKTGLQPSTVNVADLNASVISYLGHVPGYTIPIIQGLQILNPKIYNHLTVGITESSFPLMDSQPVTPGTIPYGFLPIFVSFPSYTNGLVMNNSNNNQTNVILSTTGIVSSDNLFASGVSTGDKIRILLNTPSSAQYLNLTVAGFIGSEVFGNVQTGIVFEESTRYVSTVLGTTINAIVTLISIGNDRYAPMFWQPIIVEDGTLNLIVQLYPQFTN
jgi:hypothetical protein